MKLARWIYFLLAIVIGVVLGMLLGWYLLPVQYMDTSPETLRIDFVADYVLMTAEAFGQEGTSTASLDNVMERLSFLGTAEPGELVRKALLFAEPRYADADLALLRSLAGALQDGETAEPATVEPTPGEGP